MKNIILVVFLLSSSTLSADNLVFGEPTLNGTGCPAGTVPVTLSPNNNSLTLLLNGLTDIPRSDCIVRIPMSNENSTLVQVHFRGFHHLPQEIDSLFLVSYSIGRSSSSQRLDVIHGPHTNEHIYDHQLNITSSGTKILSMSMQSLLAGISNDTILYSLDSIDFAAASIPGIALQLSCSAASSIFSSTSLWMAALASLFVL